MRGGVYNFPAMKNLLLFAAMGMALSSMTAAFAHQSGCHRWHSCPSDSGSYTCGDKGHCNFCPDNQFCEGGSPRKQTPGATENPSPGTVPKYERKSYKHWIDGDRDCRNTRHEVLHDQSVEKPKLSKDSCKVIGGKWTGPYGGETFTAPQSLDIDHIVPLKEAHRSGAWAWSKQKKEEFANDQESNLLAVDRRLNRRKGDKDPADWMPSTNQCDYLVRWLTVKTKWRLDMDDRERAAISRLGIEYGCHLQ